MEVLTLYRLCRWDGGDRTNPTPYCFKDPHVADQAKGQNDSIQKEEFIICDSVQDVTQAEETNKKIRALSRLSERDRETLGIPIDNGEAIEFFRNK